MNIVKVVAREIFDSRGQPTVECSLTLENEQIVTASVPSGLSKGSFETVELRDGGDRLLGKGVLRALEISKIKSLLLFWIKNQILLILI